MAAPYIVKAGGAPQTIMLKGQYDTGADRLQKHFSFKEGMAVVGINNKNGFFDYKYGFIDKTGTEIIPLKYDYAEPFSEDLACVELDGKCGFIDKTGNEVIPLKYDNVWPFSEGLARVKIGDKFGFIDKSGNEVIPCIYKSAYSFSDGLAAVKSSSNSKYGFIDKAGNEVIPFKYDEVGSLSDDLFNPTFKYLTFKDGVSVVGITTTTSKPGATFWDGYTKYGLIDKNGNQLTPIKYDHIYTFSEDLAEVWINGEGGYIDRTGREVIPPKYIDIGPFREGFAAVAVAPNKYGFIDKTGKMVIPAKYFGAYYFSDGLAPVSLSNGLYGYINKNGKIVIPIKYNYAIPFSEGLAVVNTRDGDGYIDKSGKLIMPAKLKAANSFKEGLAIAEQNNKLILIKNPLVSKSNPSSTSVTEVPQPPMTLEIVSQPKQEYAKGEGISFAVKGSSNGKVEYRVTLYNGTTRKTTELWNSPKTGYYNRNLQFKGTDNFTINWPLTNMEPGCYSFTIYARTANGSLPYEAYVKTQPFYVK